MLRACALCFTLACATVVYGQTTQSTVAGRVYDAQTGQALSNAVITCQQVDVGPCLTVQSDSQGFFTLPWLAPGVYQFRATAAGHQPQEIHQQTLPVASRLELTFGLRPESDVYGAKTQRLALLPNGRILDFFAADFETKGFATVAAVLPQPVAQQSTLSYTVDPDAVDRLPLNGRDVYSVLVLQPGMVSDTSTGRGLGLAANGQRPAASNFLLDGVENNYYLVTGPSYSVSPEAVQEYSVSTNNFSAEYGGTSGYVANAVTKSGGEAWHGLGYYYLRNELLDANDFQRNRGAVPREPLREARPGFQIGGPLQAGGFFVSAALEVVRFGSRLDPATYMLPTTSFQPAPGSLAGTLLDRFLPVRPSDSLGRPSIGVSIAAPDRLNQLLGLVRIDRPYRQSRDRLMVRLAYSLVDRPDFVWSPYPDFVTPLKQDAGGVLVSSTNSLQGGLTGEFRASSSWDQVSFDRRWPGIPTLIAADGTSLPGYPGLYSLRNQNRNLEFSGNLIYPHASHLVTLGGGLLFRSITGYLDPGAHAVVYFTGIGGFGAGTPSTVLLALDRAQPGAFTTPPFDRAYRNNQFFLYAQDAWKVTSRLTLDYGLRYENFGVPKNTGPEQDLMVGLGEGNTLPQHLMHAKLTPVPIGQALYSADNNNFAGRAGFAYRIPRTAATVIRGAYGIFYDRPFDNLWQNTRNNRFALALFEVSSPRLNYLQPTAALATALSGSTYTADGPDLTLYQPGIRDGYAQNYFLGLSRPTGRSWAFEWNAVGSLGRKLITTDLVNRDLSLPLSPGVPSDPANPLRRFQPDLPYIAYRANQGASNYQAFTSVARYRSGPVQAQISYTLSHTIDNQSDPLAGEFFDLRSLLTVQTANHVSAASFAQQFNSRGDRGDSDFDQRHNLVMWATWEMPWFSNCLVAKGLLCGWQFSAVGAIRSGFPYTVRAATSFSLTGETIVNNRAQLVEPSQAFIRQDADGGKLLLNDMAFSDPAPGTLGDLPRNSVHGPGLANCDVSLSRTFPLRWLGGAGRLTVRADAYNALNHANLNNPDAFVGSPTFGVATFGRQGAATGSPIASPLDERARQVQILLRLRF